MEILLLTHEDDAAVWRHQLERADPTLRLRDATKIHNADSVEYAIVGRTRPGDLAAYPNLKAILSMWAGVEHLLDDPTVPVHVPIVRMVEPSLTRGMVDYVCCHVLNFLLRTHEYGDRNWRHKQKINPRYSDDMHVGVLGLGQLGGACAEALVSLGFPVQGWSRSRKHIDGVESFAGNLELEAFLSRAEILVMLLPRTPATENILNSNTLKQLPSGACILNAGRGEQIDDAALLAALDAGVLSEVVLDVFRDEPLPQNHRFWSHPRVTVTPHVASVTSPCTAAPVLVGNLHRLQRGDPVSPLVDRRRGY